MKQVSKTWLILALALSLFTVSCKKDMLTDNEPALSGQQNDRSAQDMLSDKVKLSNEVIIDWSNLASNLPVAIWKGIHYWLPVSKL